MSPEDAATWKEMNDKYGDVVKDMHKVAGRTWMAVMLRRNPTFGAKGDRVQITEQGSVYVFENIDDYRSHERNEATFDPVMRVRKDEFDPETGDSMFKMIASKHARVVLRTSPTDRSKMKRARQMGAEAFRSGKPKNPTLNHGFMDFVKATTHNPESAIGYLDAYTEGWRRGDSGSFVHVASHQIAGEIRADWGSKHAGGSPLVTRPNYGSGNSALPRGADFEPGHVTEEGYEEGHKVGERFRLAWLVGGGKESKFEEGVPADPTKNMSPEDAAEWKRQHEEHKDEFTKNAATPRSKQAVVEEHPTETASLLPGDISPEREAKFEEGIPADPTKNMNEEEKRKWDRYHGKVDELRKEAADRIADEWIQDAVKHPGSLRKHYGIPEGETIPVERLRADQERLRDKDDKTDDESHLLRQINLALNLRDQNKTAAYGDPYWMTTKYPGKSHDGKPIKPGTRVFYYPKTKTMLVGPEAEKAAKNFQAYAFDEDMYNHKSAAAGLYGFAKYIQADCDGACKKLAKAAEAIARTVYARDAKVADFLSTHATRTESVPAHLLVAAMRGMAPRIATHLNELRTIQADFKLTDADKKVLEAFIDRRVAASKALSSDGKTLDGLWMGGKKMAEWMGGSWIQINDNGGKSSDVIARYLRAHASKGMLKAAGTKQGLYGFAGRTAKLGLQACTELRHEAGRIANDLHTRRADRHEKITGFFLKHADEGGCKYSQLLHASYPDAKTRLASTTPTTVDGWLKKEI